MVTCGAEGDVSDGEHRRISLIVETNWTVRGCCYCGKGCEDALLSEPLLVMT
jgi:hypothetical protein